MAVDFMAKLQKMEGAINVDDGYDPFLNGVRSPSPSMNWAYGIAGHCLPYGTSMILWGPPKGGKSIICNAMIGQLHTDDPEAFSVTFNTELRGQLQTGQQQMKLWHIDPSRHITYDVNQPELIFDRIANDLDALCKDGMKLKFLIIDSLTGIVGRRTQNADSILKMQIGDEALTIKDGLKMILPVLRRHKIAAIFTAHIRAELDQLEQMRGKTVKMAAAWATKHTAEIFAYVEPNRTKAGRTALDGSEYKDDSMTDFMDKSMKTGHKIRFRVDESSIGPQGRTAEFTLDYNKGIINTHEEVFTLGVNLGIIEKPNNVSYVYNGKKWAGLANMLNELRDNKEMAEEIVKEIMKRDLMAHNDRK